MLKMNEGFFCLCTKVRLRLLKGDDFDMDVNAQKIQNMDTVERDWAVIFPKDCRSVITVLLQVLERFVGSIEGKKSSFMRH